MATDVIATRVRAAWSTAVALAIAVVGAIVLSSDGSAAAVLSTSDIASESPGYLGALAACGRRRARAERLALAAPRSWIRRGELAAAHLACGRLTGDYDSFALADRASSQAFARTGGRVGPWLVRAELSFTLHRFDDVEPDLRAVEQQAERLRDPAIRARVLALRGSLALERGRVADARRLLSRALALDPTHDALARLSLLHRELGQLDEAERLLDESEEALPPHAHEARAWVHLQRGLLDLERGDAASALAHYQRADALFAGWWLVEEHIAEAEAQLGRRERAISRYRRVVARTRDPELMAALATLLRDDHPQEAERLRRDARAILETRLERFPEATYGHALDFYLDHEPDAARAVAIAEKNAALRPNRVALAKLAEARARASEAPAAISTATGKVTPVPAYLLSP